MKIRISRYNAPFIEPPVSGVHFISRENAILMRLGFFTSHVSLYRRRFPNRPLLNMPARPVFESIAEQVFLDDLFYGEGVIAAGRRAGRC